MSKENADARTAGILAAHRAFNAGELDVAFAGLALDVEWHSAPYVFDGGLLRGRQAVIDFFSGIRDAGDWQVEPHTIVNAGERCVVVHQRGSYAGRATRIEGTIDFFQVWEFGANGLVVRVREYESREDALNAAGLEA